MITTETTTQVCSGTQTTQVCSGTQETSTVFTFFGKGYWSSKAQKYVPSTHPQFNVDIPWVYTYIKERACEQTLGLRQLMESGSEQELRDYKLLHFDAVAVAGTFSHGSAAGLLVRSPYVAVDIDDLDSTEEARAVQQMLCRDENVETALCFLSPKGLGIKWLVEIPVWCQGFDFAEQYATLSRYLGFQYGLQADPTGSNVNRLCFLPHDPLCYVNRKFLQNK